MKKILSTLCALSFLTVAPVNGEGGKVTYEEKVTKTVEELSKNTKTDEKLENEVSTKYNAVAQGVKDQFGGMKMTKSLFRTQSCLEKGLGVLKEFQTANKNLASASEKVATNAKIEEHDQEIALTINLTAVVLQCQLQRLITKYETLIKSFKKVTSTKTGTDKNLGKNLEALITELNTKRENATTENQMLISQARNIVEYGIGVINDAKLKTAVTNARNIAKAGLNAKQRQVGKLLDSCIELYQAFKELEEAKIGGKSTHKDKLQKIKEAKLSEGFRQMVYLAQLYLALINYYAENSDNNLEILKASLPDISETMFATPKEDTNENDEEEAEDDEEETATGEKDEVIKGETEHKEEQENKEGEKKKEETNVEQNKNEKEMNDEEKKEEMTEEEKKEEEKKDGEGEEKKEEETE